MSKWIIKAFLQRSFSLFPNPERINRLFQKYLTGKDKLDDVKFQNKLMHAQDHLNYLKKFAPGKDLTAIKCLELGTGQFPIVPIYYYLHGINYIYSIDVVPFLTIDRIKNTIDYFIAFKQAHPEKFTKYLSGIIPQRWQELLTWSNKINENSTVEEAISQFKTTVVIQDARNTDFKEGEFDFITSNNTFEHIYPEILEGILKEFYRILSTGGVMSHFIDMTDHFAHFDKKINVYNYLKFSPRMWKLIDNEILLKAGCV